MPGTVKLHRVLRTTPEKLYKAFTDADAMCRWIPPNGFTGRMHEMDVRVGGRFKMSFTNFGTGNTHSFGGEFLELMSGKSLRYTDKFDDPNLPGEITVTVKFTTSEMGTELHIEQSGIPDMIPLPACYLGWQESLEHLAKLVEPEIPDH